jgi:hypothetical protein
MTSIIAINIIELWGHLHAKLFAHICTWVLFWSIALVFFFVIIHQPQCYLKTPRPVDHTQHTHTHTHTQGERSYWIRSEAKQVIFCSVWRVWIRSCFRDTEMIPVFRKLPSFLKYTAMNIYSLHAMIHGDKNLVSQREIWHCSCLFPKKVDPNRNCSNGLPHSDCSVT